MSEFENSSTRMCDEISQMESKEGPYYEIWLKNYRRSVSTHCEKIASRYDQPQWLHGMQAFIAKEEAKREKRG